MDSEDKVLGEAIEKMLIEKGIQNQIAGSQNTNVDINDKIEQIKKYVSGILQVLGLDVNNDDIKETPSRVAKMYVNEIFAGL